MKSGSAQPLGCSNGAERAESVLSRELALSGIVGRSAAIRAQIAQARRYARSDAPVVIVGETGTGKEVFARAIHYEGARPGRRFVPVNCGALPDALVVNELFGHEPGAFTGALRRHAGLVEQAQGGILFLDEIDSLAEGAQAALLRFLQDRQYRPLGGNGTRTADVRIISASLTDLGALVRAGKFREDLRYRLDILRLNLPALRERREDIPLLAGHLLRRHDQKLGQSGREFSRGALDRLMAHDWPGNVRELENVIRRAIALSDSRTIEARDLDLPGATPARCGRTYNAYRASALRAFERGYLEDLLAKYHGNVSQAAQAASTPRRSFLRLIRKHGLVGLVRVEGVSGINQVPQAGLQAVKAVGGRPRKGTAEDVLTVLGDQELGRQEWFEQVQQTGLSVSLRTFARRKAELEDGGKIVCDRQGNSHRAGCQ